MYKKHDKKEVLLQHKSNQIPSKPSFCGVSKLNLSIHAHDTNTAEEKFAINI